MPQKSTVVFRPIRVFAVALVLAVSAQVRADETTATVPVASPESVSAAIHALPPAPSPEPNVQAAPAEKTAPVSSPTTGLPTTKLLPPKIPSEAKPAEAKPAPVAAPSKVPQNESLRDAAARLKLPLPLPQSRVVVLKAKRRLEVWNGDTFVKSYRVALGGKPTGHKARQGDGRTPEGEFFICTRNAQTSAFHIFLGLSYPAMPDATRGLKNRAISEREFRIIRSRLASRGAPLWRTRLGGWVGIHGGTNEKFARKQSQKRGSPDWTAGCVALTNREIEEIHAATKLGTPVSVRP